MIVSKEGGHQAAAQFDSLDSLKTATWIGKLSEQLTLSNFKPSIYH